MNMNKNAKIIFIHQGDSWYLSYALYQARAASQNFEVVLLGEGTQDSG